MNQFRTLDYYQLQNYEVDYHHMKCEEMSPTSTDTVPDDLEEPNYVIKLLARSIDKSPDETNKPWHPIDVNVWQSDSSDEESSIEQTSGEGQIEMSQEEQPQPSTSQRENAHYNLRARVRASKKNQNSIVNGKGKGQMPPSSSKAQMYVCTFEDCTKTYQNNYNLNRHMFKAHYNIEPYRCGWIECARKFSYHYEVLKHIRIAHLGLSSSRPLSSVSESEEKDNSKRFNSYNLGDLVDADARQLSKKCKLM